MLVEIDDETIEAMDMLAMQFLQKFREDTVEFVGFPKITDTDEFMDDLLVEMKKNPTMPYRSLLLTCAKYKIMYSHEDKCFLGNQEITDEYLEHTKLMEG